MVQGVIVSGRGTGGVVVAGRVLVIEDDASLARSIVDGLSDDGFTVAHAGDGDSAQRRCGTANGISSSSTGGCPARTA